MKYNVSGSVRNKKFNLEVDAKSENHAKHLATVKLGSSQRVKASSIKIDQIKKTK